MKTKIFVILLALLASAGGAFAQSTTLSGTVTDAGSQTWNNGTYTLTFVPNPQYPVGPYTWSGGALTTTFTGALSGTGTYSVSIPANTSITPQGSKWNLQVSPNATWPSYTIVPFSVTGSTQTQNVTPPAIAINLSVSPGSFTTAYADAEIAYANLGNSYFNVTSLVGRVCTASTGGVCGTWANQGGGGGGSGTVTSFSAGTLSPLFTTSVATATTTPALTFSLSNAAQNAFLGGPATGGAGAPAYRALVTADLPSGIAFLAGGNTSTGLQNLTGATLTVPSSASYVPTTAALFGYDSTNNRFVGGNGTNTSFLTWITTSPTSGHCPQFSGTLGLLVDSGAACASGGGNTTSTSLTTNTLPKANGANSIVNSSVSDNGTTVSTTEGMSAASYTATGTCNGGTAGCFIYTQGTAPTVTSNGSATRYAPSSITDYIDKIPSAAASGLYRWNASGTSVTDSVAELSGDVTTSGSNAATVVQVEGAAIPTSAAVVGTNASKQLVASTAANVNTVIQGLTGCSTASNVYTPAGSDCVAPSGGSSAWNSITNPTGNLALTMGTDTSTFTYSSALNNAYVLQNTTPAISGTNQPSPVFVLAGQAFDGATPANTVSSVAMQWNPPNGNNESPQLLFTPTTSTTSAATRVVFGTPFNALYIGGLNGTTINQTSFSCGLNFACTILASGNTETLTLQPGSQGGANPQGFLKTLQSFYVASVLANNFEVVCGTTTAYQVAACGLGANNVIGIAQSVGGTNTQLFVVMPGSKSTVVFDGTPVLGDVACSPPASTGTAGLAHDNGTTACTLGEFLGVVTDSVSGTGSGATATVVLR